MGKDAGLQRRPRYEILDFLRGFMMLNVLLFHLLYDLHDQFDVNLPWFESLGAYFWQQTMAGTLIVISGISCHFSRNNLRRGAELLGIGCVISVATFVSDKIGFTSGAFIAFGIIHFIGAANLLYALGERLIKKIPEIAGFLASVCLFACTKGLEFTGLMREQTGIYHGFLGIGRIPLVHLPESLYSGQGMAWLGFPTEQFRSSDYFPVLPWIFLFFAGFFFWRLVKDRAWMEKIAGFRLPPINWVGRHTLILYIIHQPIIYGILYLVFLF